MFSFIVNMCFYVWLVAEAEHTREWQRDGLFRKWVTSLLSFPLTLNAVSWKDFQCILDTVILSPFIKLCM